MDYALVVMTNGRDYLINCKAGWLVAMCTEGLTPFLELPTVNPHLEIISEKPWIFRHNPQVDGKKQFNLSAIATIEKWEPTL